MTTPEELLAEVREIKEQLTAAQAEVATRNSLDEALVEIKKSWQKWFIPVVAFALACVVVVGVVLIANNRTVNRIEDCTIQTGACYKRLTSGGQTGVARLITYFDCVESTEIADRTPNFLASCRAKALDTK